jgi:hypothetical protein
MYLVDTNLISEARKGARANSGVRRFLSDASPEDLYLSVQTLGELRCGVERLRNRGDERVGRVRRAGTSAPKKHRHWPRAVTRQRPPPGTALPAVGLRPEGLTRPTAYDLVVVTRDTSDFGGTGVALLDPFR